MDLLSLCKSSWISGSARPLGAKGDQGLPGQGGGTVHRQGTTD